MANTLQANIAKMATPSDAQSWYVQAMERLIQVVQDLSHARDVDSIGIIVRNAARNLTGADGATFVLRDGDMCYYADENAISPLWKGQRFPMRACISGWVMLRGESTVIEDIYVDPRIPADAYRPTFVKSLAMVPIRRDKPIGAIGNYWAQQRRPLEEEVMILQALADTTSVAMENAQLYTELQVQIKALRESNYELGRFAWVASHDLQEPLRTIATQVDMLARRYGGQLDERGQGYLRDASNNATRLQNLIEDMLVHVRAERTENFKPTALNLAIEDAKESLHRHMNDSGASISCSELPWIWGDPQLLSRLFYNLLSNSIKFSRKDAAPEIRISSKLEEQWVVVSVEDNGIGIETDYREQIFGLFQRLYAQSQYAGSGIGLATCKKIMELHNGRIWVESMSGKGSTFHCAFPAIRNIE